MPEALQSARAAVDLARTVIDTGARTLADRSSDNGKVSVAKLDEHQGLAYDLAHAAAAVEGSRVMGEYGERGEVESMLARAYVADAVHDVASRVLGRGPAWNV